MTLPIQIVDPSHEGIRAAVSNKNDYEYHTHNALVVHTDELRHFDNAPHFFTNDTYGAEMAQDASATGTPINVHDGIDSVYWTATSIAGTFVFDSSDQAQDGFNSIDCSASLNDDLFQTHQR